MMFKVNQQFDRGPDIPLAAFGKQNDAMLFIQAKLNEDVRFKVNAKYHLMEGMELMKEFTQADREGGNDSSGGTGRGSGISPFSTSARPPGTPTGGGWGSDDPK